ESLHFLRLGTFLERADNTARLIDVKFHGMPYSAAELETQDATPADFYYWTSLLRSVSAFEIYRKVYRDVITPHRVAELLMLDPEMPRSLIACLEEVIDNLRRLSNSSSGETERLAGKLHAELKFARIEEILEADLHEYLKRFLEKIYGIGEGITRSFLMPLNAESPPELRLSRALARTMILSIRHETIYRYTEPVGYSIQHLPFSPRTVPHPRTL